MFEATLPFIDHLLIIFSATTIHPPCQNNVEEPSAPPPYNYIALLPKAQAVEGINNLGKKIKKRMSF